MASIRPTERLWRANAADEIERYERTEPAARIAADVGYGLTLSHRRAWPMP